MYKLNINFAIGLLALCLTQTMTGKELEDKSIITIVKEQVSSIHWHTLIDNDNWGFTVETTLINVGRKKQQRIQSYDPSKADDSQWQLIEDQYEQPSKSTLNEYAKTQQSIANEDTPDYAKGIDIVDKKTIEFKHEDELYYVFSFTPVLPMFDREINENFAGDLYFNKKNKSIERLHLKAKESFSPGMSADIETYEMNLVIKTIEGELHVTSINSDKSGTLFFFTDFNEKSSREFSNFHAVSP